jgi:hypothetical protein
MDDPFHNPEETLPEKTHSEDAPEPGESRDLEPAGELAISKSISDAAPEWIARHSAIPGEHDALRRRGFRHNLLLLLSFTLAAFILTVWILVRVDSPFGIIPAGPQEVVRAQLEALDRGEIRPAYDMFSARYRGQVSFNLWRELIASHWRMFHAEVLRAGAPAQTGASVTLEMFLRGADQKAYRAQFTLMRMDGRWWIDDLHWTEEPDARDVFHT